MTIYEKHPWQVGACPLCPHPLEVHDWIDGQCIEPVGPSSTPGYEDLCMCPYVVEVDLGFRLHVVGAEAS